MSRRARVERRLPLFQIKVADFTNHSYKTIVVKKGKERQKIDIPSKAPCRTLLKHFRDGKAAIRFASRIGTVLSCFKVDTDPYLKNIEYLNLEQTFSVEVGEKEYVLNKALELSRPRKDFEGKKFDVQMLDNEE